MTGHTNLSAAVDLELDRQHERAKACTTALAGIENPAAYVAAFEGMERALEQLHLAECAYRQAHDLHGDGSAKAGRAWDLMRRASQEAATALQSARAARGEV